MAQRISTTYSDDLDGNEDESVATRRFGLDGRDYVAEFSTANYERLRKAMDEFIAVARPAGQRVPVRTQAGRQRSSDIRAWARARGYEVEDHGRIKASVIAEYNAAH